MCICVVLVCMCEKGCANIFYVSFFIEQPSAKNQSTAYYYPQDSHRREISSLSTLQRTDLGKTVRSPWLPIALGCHSHSCSYFPTSTMYVAFQNIRKTIWHRPL